MTFAGLQDRSQAAVKTGAARLGYCVSSHRKRPHSPFPPALLSTTQLSFKRRNQKMWSHQVGKKKIKPWPPMTRSLRFSRLRSPYTMVDNPHSPPTSHTTSISSSLKVTSWGRWRRAPEWKCRRNNYLRQISTKSSGLLKSLNDPILSSPPPVLSPAATQPRKRGTRRGRPRLTPFPDSMEDSLQCSHCNSRPIIGNVKTFVNLIFILYARWRF